MPVRDSGPYPRLALDSLKGGVRSLESVWATGDALILHGHRNCKTTRQTLPYVDRIHRRKGKGDRPRRAAGRPRDRPDPRARAGPGPAGAPRGRSLSAGGRVVARGRAHPFLRRARDGTIEQGRRRPSTAPSSRASRRGWGSRARSSCPRTTPRPPSPVECRKKPRRGDMGIALLTLALVGTLSLLYAIVGGYAIPAALRSWCARTSSSPSSAPCSWSWPTRSSCSSSSPPGWR